MIKPFPEAANLALHSGVLTPPHDELWLPC
jgi:hypothetical protein